MGLTATSPLDVSVVIPAFNAAATLGETIASLQAQTYASGTWEAVVVDDGSTDDTAAVARALAAADPRVRFVSKPNAGVSATRNRGLREARNPWILFLDADDLLVPEALEWFMDEVRRDPELDMVYGGWCRLLPDGRLFDEVREVPADDLFRSFSGTCAFAIHACVTRRDLILAAGGFDESLVTCEDWDLWQRLARGRLKAVEVPRRIAIYRLRAQSASNDGVRMLTDGLEVIDRGHGEDPRVVEPVEALRAGADVRMAGVAKLGMAAYCAGLVLGRGGDPEAVLTLVDGLEPTIADPAVVGSTIAAAVPLGRALLATDWPSFEPELWDAVDALLARFETIAGVPLFARRARKSFDRAILAALDGTAGALRLGGARVLDVEVSAPLADVALEDGVERLVCRVRYRDELLGELELPAFGPAALAWHLADAIAEQVGWTVLARHLEREVEPGLADGEDPDARTWELFLQQLWGLPGVPTGDFYNLEADVAGGPAGAPIAAAGGTVEIAAPLPALPDGEVSVAVLCGGAPLGTVVVGADAPRTPHALRAAIVWQSGFELCVAAVRGGLIGAPVGATLRERLAAAAASTDGAAPPPSALRVGVAPAGTLAGPVARRGTLPAALADDVAALAGFDGRPARRGDGDVVVVDPALLEHHLPVDEADRPGSAPEGSSPEEFDALFARTDDPWSYDNDYERQKYDRTLALAPRRVGTALELGCAAGHFTVRLAERADDVLALDVSPFALNHARRRVEAAGAEHVRFARHDLFADTLPVRAAELVVCSEVLYYAGTVERLRFAIGEIAAAVAPGGALVTAHARLLVDDERGFPWGLPFGAASITHHLHDSFLRLEAEIVTDAYVVQRWGRPTGRIAARRPRRVRRERAALPERLPPSVAEMLRNDGRAAEITRREHADRVPVLAYHRISPEGSDFNAQWRSHPEQFEAHLAHLRGEGYYSVTAEELGDAMRARRPLRGRPLVISFDDAYADFPDYAWPLLRRYGFSATIFAVADCVGGHNAWDDHRGERLGLMDWDTLRRLQAQGAEIGSHTAAHPPLSALAPREVAADLVRSRLVMARELGRPPVSLAYPFGDVDAPVARVAAAVGFTVAFTCEPGTARFDGAPMTAPRIEVTGDDDVAALASKLAAH